MDSPEITADPVTPAPVIPTQRPPRIWKFWGTALWGLFIFAAMFVGQLAVEKLALLAAAAALNIVSPHHAELFARTRLATTHAGMYGAVDLANDDIKSLLARALP